MSMSQMHILYRLYDREWHLLYIGATENLFFRISGHKIQRLKKPWFKSVRFIQVQHFRTRKACFAAERKSINKEKPIHNIKRSFK